MSEPKVNEKKVAGRSVAIALGIICIILAVGLAAAVSYYVTVMNSRIADRDNTISQLTSQVTGLNSQVSNLTDIVNLAKATPWRTDVTLNNQTTEFFSEHPDYVGYVQVYAAGIGAFHVLVELYYAAGDPIPTLAPWPYIPVAYDRTVYVDYNSSMGEHSAWFPVVPSAVFVNITDISSTDPVRVSVTYYY